MQSKALLNKVKKLEKKIFKDNRLFIYFEEPTALQLAMLPSNAKVIVFKGEDEIAD